MNATRREARDVERLLQQTLADDLPPALEAQLHAGLRPAWRRAVAADALQAREARAAAERPWPAWSALRAALASAALLTTALGAAVQLAGSASLSANAASGGQTALWVAQQLHAAETLQAEVETWDQTGHAVRRQIRWTSSGYVPCRLEEMSLLRWAADPTREERVRQPADEPPAAIESCLSPARVAALLAGDWEPSPEGLAGPNAPTWIVERPGDTRQVRVAIDPRRYLPIQLEVWQAPAHGNGRPTWTALLSWEPDADSRSVAGGGPGSE